ncbi:MAG: hypothetical protein IPL07_02405 [Acidimicrobiaceae bacterium]|nr:hypothetical protein [Acidimicrobiaceae bacterium]
MTVRLTVDRRAAGAHVHAPAGFGQAVVPVVKGNGYGFGRPVLHPAGDLLAAGRRRPGRGVGTVHELHDAARAHPVVLTPAASPPAHATRSPLRATAERCSPWAASITCMRWQGGTAA